MIENTKRRDPLAHLVGMIDSARTNRDSGSGYITDMEAAGQLLQSSQLPIDGPWAELAELGFIQGQPTDDLFCDVTLPEGWTREGSQHAMGSYVLDLRGIRRVSVFYKAAFYDRKASMNLIDAGRDAFTHCMYGDEPVGLPAKWALFTDAEKQSFRDAMARMDEDIARTPQVYGRHSERMAALRSLLAEASA